MNFLDELASAARWCLEPAKRERLRDARDNLAGALIAIGVEPIKANMVRLNNAWIFAEVVMAKDETVGVKK